MDGLATRYCIVLYWNTMTTFPFENPNIACLTLGSTVVSPRRRCPTGNPWWTIYEETKNDPIPTATAVPIPDSGSDDDDDDGYDDDDSDRSSDKDDGNTAEHPSHLPQQGSNADNNNNNDDDGSSSIAHHRNPPHCCATCSPLQLALAVLVAVPAIVGVLVCELFALVVLHVPATLVYLTATKLLSPHNCCCCCCICGCCYGVLMLVHRILCACDSIVLVVSVLVTEVVAMVACLVGFCTGGALWAGQVHQHIRKICHGIRVVVRRQTTTTNNNNTNATDAAPPRRFCGWTTTEQPHPQPQQQHQHQHQHYESNNGAGATAVEGSAVGSADHEHQRLYDV